MTGRLAARRPTPRRAAAVLAACLVAALAVAGCGPSSGRDLHVENGTTRAITVLVDGAPVGTVNPGASASYPEGSLPGGVWRVEARLPGGRAVLSGEVDKTYASQTENGGSGSGLRADLLCGRLDVWVGVPMMGPAPGPGTPGDCDG
jgi:hypothetical protein